MFSEEIVELTEQLSEGGKNVLELEKFKRTLEQEKNEVQAALEESESAFEVEEGKVLRLLIEISQNKADFEKKVTEKEEENDEVRRNGQRALEATQVSLESESKNRSDAVRQKKKLEGDFDDLEVQLAHAIKSRGMTRNPG